jgi:hypothetical protein
MALNSFKTQSKVDKALYFAFKEQSGIADKIDWRSDEFSATNNLGASISLRRPTEMQATVTGLGNDESLPSNTQPTVGYKVHTEPFIPLTISSRVETNMQFSLEDLTFNLSAEQAYERAIKPAMTRMVDKINKLIIDSVDGVSGQYVAGASGPATESTGAEWLVNVHEANSIMEARGLVAPQGQKSLIVNPRVAPRLGPQQATVFNAVGADKTYSSGLLGRYAGYEMYSSGLLGPKTIDGTSTVTITAITLPTVWAESFSLTATIGTATLKAGTRLKFANSGTAVNTVNMSTKLDTGYAFVATVAADVTVGSGKTVVLKEVAIASGDYQNISAAITTSTTVTIANAGIVRPSYAFLNSAIAAASPEVKLPSGTKGRNVNIDGINIAIVEDHWPGTLQSITKLVAFIGVAVPMPEGVVALY